MPDTPGVARIIAIANQKGGVGKSTTAVSLGAALADLGYRVLVIDLDPQGNASTGMGIKHEARETTVYDVIVAEAPMADAIVHTPVPRLHAIPSTIDLAGAEIELVSQFSRETRLKKAMAVIREGVYDFVLLDCPPSLGLLTINALTAAEELIVPVQCEYYALEGVGQLLRNVSLVQQNINPGLRLSGILMTMFDPRTKLSEQVVAEVQRYFGDLVYDVIIPRTVRLSEAPGYGQPITVYDPKSKGAESYRELSREVALRPPPSEPMPVFDDLPAVALPALDETGSPDDLDNLADEVSTALQPPDTLEPPDTAEPVAVEPPAAPPPPTVSEARRRSAAPPPTDAPAVPQAPPPSVVEESPQVGADTPGVETLEPEDPRAMEDVDEQDDGLWEEEDPAPVQTPRVTQPRSPDPPGHLPERRVVVIDENADLRAPETDTPGTEPSTDPQHPAVADIGATLKDDEHGAGKRRWRLFRKGGD